MKIIKENSGLTVVKNLPKVTMMKSKPGSSMNFRELLLDGLKDIYWAEKALTKVIPTMVRNVTAGDLADALEWHLEETKDQVTRLEEVFVLMDQKFSARRCAAMEGLINEVEHILDETAAVEAGRIGAAEPVGDAAEAHGIVGDGVPVKAVVVSSPTPAQTASAVPASAAKAE